MSQLTQAHHWQLSSHAASAFADHTVGSSGIAISAACAVCGLARVQVIPRWANSTLAYAVSAWAFPRSQGSTCGGECPQVSALGDDTAG